MKIKITDENSVRNYEPQNAILIRALEPYSNNNEFENVKLYNDVLEFYIHDIVAPQLQPNDKYIYFTKKDAYKLNEFVLNNNYDEIVIHCSLGLSRSPAIAICIAKMFKNQKLENEILTNKHFFPNKQIISMFESINYDSMLKENIELEYENKAKSDECSIEKTDNDFFEIEII